MNRPKEGPKQHRRESGGDGHEGKALQRREPARECLVENTVLAAKAQSTTRRRLKPESPAK